MVGKKRSRSNEFTCVGWRDIAAHLAVSIRQAQRYHSQKGLPIGFPGRQPRVPRQILTLWLLRQDCNE